jgi:hypothetical protein
VGKAVAAKSHSGHLICVPTQVDNFLFRRDVPEPDRHITAGWCDSPATGLNATLWTADRVREHGHAPPVLTSQSLTLRSALADARVRPSG